MTKIEEKLSELASQTEELRQAGADNAAMRAQAQLPDDYCLACVGTGGHHEGCPGISGLLALKSQLAELADLRKE